MYFFGWQEGGLECVFESTYLLSVRAGSSCSHFDQRKQVEEQRVQTPVRLNQLQSGTKEVVKGVLDRSNTDDEVVIVMLEQHH